MLAVDDNAVRQPEAHPLGAAADPPPCPVPGCYPDYFAATGSIAVDARGHLVFAYTFSGVPNGPKSLYVRTSDDAVNWSTNVVVNALGDGSVPRIKRPQPWGLPPRLAGQPDRQVQHLVCAN